jgi:hypothetical protein
MRLFMLLALGLALLAAAMPFALADPVRKDDGPQFEYREDTKREVALLRDGMIYLGHLDSAGNFVWNSPVTPYKPDDPVLKKSTAVVINKLAKPDAPVYEFRSGTLVKGRLDEKGNFIPEPRSKIIAFKDYKYGGGSILIYNLPGTFVEKKAEKK